MFCLLVKLSATNSSRSEEYSCQGDLNNGVELVEDVNNAGGFMSYSLYSKHPLEGNQYKKRFQLPTIHDNVVSKRS